MTIKGKIIHYDDHSRLLSVMTLQGKKRIYLQRSMHQTHFKFLYPGIFIAARTQKGEAKRRRRHILKEMLTLRQPSQRRVKTLYSYRKVKTQTRDFINALNYKLFLDFEMSMHPYHKTKNFKQELIQIGYLLEDPKGNIIKKFSSYITPSKHKKLTKRTTKFLNLTQEDVDAGMQYHDFYVHFKTLLETYMPAIIVWGKNDALALKDSYRINKVKSLTKWTRFVNLLKLHKNYFNIKNDLGLKTAFEMYGNTLETQQHDAYEDAWMTKHVFDAFKAYLNDPVPTVNIPPK